MTLAEIIRAQLATGRPLRVTRALLEALAEPPAVLADDPPYSSWTALCRALALPASTPGPAIVAAVVAIRETARHDREERDAERARANEWLAQKHDAERARDEAYAEIRRLCDRAAEREEALEAAAHEVDAIHRDEVAEYGVGRGASYAEIGTWLRARAADERGGK